MPPTGAMLAQQQAQDFNMNARFGRNEMVLDQVAADDRETFSQAHRDWGNGIRVADLELVGMKEKDKDVNIMVHVAWYRPEQQELRSTTILQTWRGKDEKYVLASEKRVDGDVGLLGEPLVFQAPVEQRKPTQFPTIRLSGSDPQTGE